jgi:hypothetical protein
MVQSLPLHTNLFKQIFANTSPKGKGKGKQKVATGNTITNVTSEFNWEASVRDLRSFIESHTAQVGMHHLPFCSQRNPKPYID